MSDQTSAMPDESARPLDAPAPADDVHYCAFHPKVETEVRCSECERYICNKDMVVTPVGYKCKECARPARSQYVVVKPHQLAKAIGMGVAVGVGFGVVTAFIPIGGLFFGLVWGLGTAEAIRWASGGHRTWDIGLVSLGSIALALAIGFVLGGAMELGALVAGVVALSDLALLGRR